MDFDVVGAMTRPPGLWMQITLSHPLFDKVSLRLGSPRHSTDPDSRVCEGRVLLSLVLAAPEGIRIGDLVGFIKGGIDQRGLDIRQDVDTHGEVSATARSLYPYFEASWAVLQAEHANRGRRDAIVELSLRPYQPAMDYKGCTPA